MYSHLMKELHFSIKSMYYHGQNKTRHRNMFQGSRLKENSSLRNVSKITSNVQERIQYNGEVSFGGEDMEYCIKGEKATRDVPRLMSWKRSYLSLRRR